MSKISPQIFINVIAQFLDLHDLSICARVFKNVDAYSSVTTAVIYKNTNIRKLVEKCPRVRNLTITCDLQQYPSTNVRVRLKKETRTPDYMLIYKLPIKRLIITTPQCVITGEQFEKLEYLEYPGDFRRNDLNVEELKCETYYGNSPHIKKLHCTHECDLIQLPMVSAIFSLEHPCDLEKVYAMTSLRKLTLMTYVSARHVLSFPLIEELDLARYDSRVVFGHCPNLKKLTVCNKSINDITNRNFPALVDLTIYSVEVDIFKLTKMKLKRLSLISCTLNDVHYLELMNLESLTVVDSKHEPLPLIKCKSLKISDNCIMKTTKLFEGLRRLTLVLSRNVMLDHLPQLTYLSITGISLTSDHLRAISKLPLYELELIGCGLDDNSMLLMPHVQILNINDNNITYEGLLHLKKLSLRRLTYNGVVPLVCLLRE